LRAPNVVDEQFPTDTLTAPRTKADELWATKLQLQKDGITPFGILEAKDADFERLREREALQEEANFQAWFAKWFDYASPAQKQRAKELYPEYYEQRKRLLARQCENLFDYARLKLTGIESESDLKKQYFAETGRLDIGPLNYILHPEGAQRDAVFQQRKFQRGMWSPNRIFGDEAVGYTKDETESRIRDRSALAYAERRYPEQLFQIGTFEGVPPTNSNAQDQGIVQWWQVLRNAVQ